VNTVMNLRVPYNFGKFLSSGAKWRLGGVSGGVRDLRSLRGAYLEDSEN
jgi:hypothetical protein